MVRFKRSLFLFRRDLRLDDNKGLLFALKNSQSVICAFIFTPEQIADNPFQSIRCLKFMVEALEDLSEQLHKQGGRLYFFKGTPHHVVAKIQREIGIDAVIVNTDYTPYSKKRDLNLQKVCDEYNIAFHSFDDALLLPPSQSVKKDGTPYTVFTPYFRNARQIKVDPPEKNVFRNFYTQPIASSDASLLNQIRPPIINEIRGGRNEALKRLNELKSFKYYATLRDFPAENATTSLSAFLKFTCCSSREVYASICAMLHPTHELVRALFWRDFFTTITHFFPHVFEGAFHQKFNHLSWKLDRNAFQRWCDGTTGFPIVDAGMRELNETGFMHNRVRMITGSFLVKNLHLNWQWGEKYFAQTLIDYDPAVNNGNWQWVASTGCDAQPYFRIFNPWRQQQRFDPECLYIKKWVPELKSIPPKILHNWHQTADASLYFEPMVDHQKSAQEALQLYTKAAKRR